MTIHELKALRRRIRLHRVALQAFAAYYLETEFARSPFALRLAIMTHSVHGREPGRTMGLAYHWWN